MEPAESSKSDCHKPLPNQSPFFFLDGVCPDFVPVIHAVILSSLSPQDKNEIIIKVLKNDKGSWNRYIDWRKQTAKIPPNESFSLLPTAVQNELWKKVEYSSYEDFKAICDQYPNTTQKLQNWLKLVQDPKSYLTAVYERARQQLEDFNARGAVDKATKNFTMQIHKTQLHEPLKIVPPETPVPAPRKAASTQKFINILLLGESGVGKTTFINSLVNYLNFLFDEIMKKNTQPLILVDTAFTVFSEGRKSKKIQVRADKEYQLSKSNEIQRDGESSTQDPITYKYSWIDDCQEKVIQIIDTPGFNDTRGVSQDSHNAKIIQEHIDRIGQIDAVCILMKPNETRMSSGLKTFLTNILSNLYPKVTRNVIFCFTNCRSTMYKPAESLDTLRKYLKDLKDRQGIDIKTDKSNLFCFDNDCFRYMLTTKVFKDMREASDDAIYGDGWRHNSDEIRRFLSAVKMSLPHTTNSAEVNQIRDLSYSLAPVFLKIAKKLEQRKKELEDEESRSSGQHNEKRKAELDLIDTESRQLLEVCTELSAFLKYKTSCSSTDPFDEALKTLIAEEEKSNGASYLFYALQALKVEYIDMTKIASENIQEGRRKILTADELVQSVEKLSHLKLCGSTVKPVVESHYENVDSLCSNR